MRNKTYALLISGIFSVMLLPSAFALEATGYSDSGKWRPVQGQDSQIRQNAQPGPDSRAGGNYYPQHRPQSYNFRPWDGYPGQNNRVSSFRTPKTGSAPFNWRDSSYRQGAINPSQDHWRPATPVAYPGFPGNNAGSQYRFRPMDRERRAAAPMKWTYRPTQIDIPNHYVYRPLKVKRNSNPANQQRLKSPAVPGIYDYGYKPQDPVLYGYTPSGLPHSGSVAPSYADYPYVDRHNRYFAGRPSGRYYGQPVAGRYSYPRDYTSPRYTGHMPFGGYRFRPQNRPRWERYPYRGQPNRYAANPYPAPNYQRSLPGWDHQYAMQPAWYPQMTTPYPGTQQAMGWPGMPNRYGVNWYDGRGDGEGAWYQMAGRQEWPRVSQYLPLD